MKQKTIRCTWCSGSGIKPDGLFEKSDGSECNSCDGSGFDTQYTDEITCPYCGHEERDSSEFIDASQWQCGECNKYSFMETHHSVSYTTKRVECLNDSSKHIWKKQDWYEPRGGKTYARCKLCSQHSWIPDNKLESRKGEGEGKS